MKLVSLSAVESPHFGHAPLKDLVGPPGHGGDKAEESPQQRGTIFPAGVPREHLLGPAAPRLRRVELRTVGRQLLLMKPGALQCLSHGLSLMPGGASPESPGNSWTLPTERNRYLSH